jgi:hypothetical protein
VGEKVEDENKGIAKARWNHAKTHDSCLAYVDVYFLRFHTIFYYFYVYKRDCPNDIEECPVI